MIDINRKLALFFLLFVIFFSGCSAQVSNEDAVKKILDAAENLESYKFDATIKVNMETGFGQQNMNLTFSMNGVADEVKKRMFMNIDASIQGLSIKTEGYIIDNVIYAKTIGGQWTKQTQINDIWETRSQYDYAIDLLNGSKVEMLPEEIIKGKSNYVIKITPDLEKLLEKSFSSLGTSQQKPQFFDNLDKNLDKIIKSFFVKIWIQKDTFYISKSNVIVSIDYKDPKSVSDLKMGINSETLMYEHNKPVTIELPEEAKNAVENNLSAIKPAAGLNEACKSSFDCKSDLICINDICSEKGDVGDACLYWDDCKPELDCVNSICAEKLNLGDKCSFSADCKSMLCVNEICIQGANVGESCTSSIECKIACYNFSSGGRSCENLPCINNKCSEELDLGASCSSGSECKSYICVNKRCSKTRGKIGDTCASPSDCNENITCINNLCREKANAGEACSWDSDCRFDICIDNLCTEGKVGDVCKWGPNCKSGICENGICSNLKAIAGEACAANSDCGTNKCENNVCKKNSAGEPCFSGSDCISYACTNYVCN